MAGQVNGCVRGPDYRGKILAKKHDAALTLDSSHEYHKQAIYAKNREDCFVWREDEVAAIAGSGKIYRCHY